MEIVVLQNNEPRTTTIIVARGMNIKHRAIMELVEKYEEELKEFGVFTFETGKPIGDKGGRPIKFAWINEGQTGYLISLMRNSEIVRKFKRDLMKAFLRQREVISRLLGQRNDAQWLAERTHGKISRKEETDMIKEFVEYAKTQGSTKSNMYYIHFTNATYKALFILEFEFKELRNILNGQQLQYLATAESAVAKALQYGMDQGMHYKDIYLLAKERLEQFSEIVGKSVIPADILTYTKPEKLTTYTE